MSNDSITYRGAVYPAQCDHMGHMNVMWYVGKFDEASWQLLARLGLTNSRIHAERVGMAAVSQKIEYKRELRAGDTVSVRSTIAAVGNTSLRIEHEMRNDDTADVVATMTVVAVHLDLVTREPRRLPDDIRERATRHLLQLHAV